MSLRDQILAAQDRTIKKIDVPEWNVSIEIRSMTAAQRVGLFQEAYDQETGQPNLRLLYLSVIVNCCFDPKTGEQIFTMADADSIMSKSGTVIERVALDAINLSGMDKDAVTEAGKAILGNPNDDSSMN